VTVAFLSPCCRAATDVVDSRVTERKVHVRRRRRCRGCRKAFTTIEEPTTGRGWRIALNPREPTEWKLDAMEHRAAFYHGA
jgi:hypothetical protein